MFDPYIDNDSRVIILDQNCFINICYKSKINLECTCVSALLGALRKLAHEIRKAFFAVKKK